ncbi:MFS transporter [Massilia sp. B-10]|nr:MFS transporter [Massilia sp. B-10]
MSQPATAASLAFQAHQQSHAVRRLFRLRAAVLPAAADAGAGRRVRAHASAQSSWTLSVSTLCMAIALLLSGLAADRIGSRRLMSGALAAAAVLTVLGALAHNFVQLLVLRALLGFALGGMPMVAMAYLAREIEAYSLGLSMGVYIGGTAVGGMVGRLVASLISDFFSWRLSMAVIGAAKPGGGLRVLAQSAPNRGAAWLPKAARWRCCAARKPAPARRPRHALAVSAGFFADGRLRQPV